MPPGAKKRKALRKKQQQQATGTSTNNHVDNLHGGNDEHGSQDDRESDNNLSSLGSQGNEQFGGTQDPSADTAKEISDATQGLGPNCGNDIAVERETDDKKIIAEESKNVASKDPCVKEVAPVVDSVSKVVVSEKSEHAETSKHSNLVSGETKEYPTTGLEKENGKLATLPGSEDAGTSRQVESESEVPLSSQEKQRLMLPGPPAVRTSWLSCCGLFDAMTGSDR